MINAAQRPIEEEKKQPETPQTVQPTGGAATSAPSIDAHPRVNQQPIVTVQQLADVNQATLQAFQSILAQQLEEKLETKLREQREMLEVKQREQKDELKEIRLDLHSQSALLQNV